MHSPVIIRRGICTPPVFIRRGICTPLAILTLPYNLLLRCSAIGQVLDSIDAIFFYSVPAFFINSLYSCLCSKLPVIQSNIIMHGLFSVMICLVNYVLSISFVMFMVFIRVLLSCTICNTSSLVMCSFHFKLLA